MIIRHERYTCDPTIFPSRRSEKLEQITDPSLEAYSGGVMTMETHFNLVFLALSHTLTTSASYILLHQP
jgi:hypothetical protein